MEGTSSVTQVNSENMQPERLDNWADLRRPDVKIHVKRGQTLAMQTEGMMLTAIDAAVQHDPGEGSGIRHHLCHPLRHHHQAERPD